MPKWLVIATFEDLKEKLIGVIIVLLGVSYLGTAVTWAGDKSILNLGVATAAVILALAIALYLSTKSHVMTHQDHEKTAPADQPAQHP
jgi:uncharacterized membrane protein YqhA